MTTSRHRRTVAASVVALATLAVSAGAPAHAQLLGTSGPVRYDVVAAAAEPGSTSVMAFGSCDLDHHAMTAIGVSTSGGSGLRSIETLNDLYGSSVWTMYAGAGWSGSGGTVSLFGLCLSEQTGYSYGADTVSTKEAATSVTQTSMCGEGSATSGTFGEGGEGYALHESYPVDDASDADTSPDDGWRSVVSRPSGSTTVPSFDAFCVVLANRPLYRRSTVSVPAHTTVSKKALCPDDRVVVGGGIEMSGKATSSRVSATRPVDGGDADSTPDDGWLATTQNTSGNAQAMVVHAVCA